MNDDFERGSDGGIWMVFYMTLLVSLLIGGAFVWLLGFGFWRGFFFALMCWAVAFFYSNFKNYHRALEYEKSYSGVADKQRWKYGFSRSDSYRSNALFGLFSIVILAVLIFLVL